MTSGKTEGSAEVAVLDSIIGIHAYTQCRGLTL